MYKSPISIYETAVKTIMEQRENAIFAKVQDAFDVQVDKQELIRALMYDRNQYEKGYADGKADAMAELVRCKDCKHYNTDGCDDSFGWCEMLDAGMSDNWFCFLGEVQVKPNVTDQTMDALKKMGEKVHGG